MDEKTYRNNLQKRMLGFYNNGLAHSDPLKQVVNRIAESDDIPADVAHDLKQSVLHALSDDARFRKIIEYIDGEHYVAMSDFSHIDLSLKGYWWLSPTGEYVGDDMPEANNEVVWTTDQIDSLAE